jgi:hypothetical protein
VRFDPSENIIVIHVDHRSIALTPREIEDFTGSTAGDVATYFFYRPTELPANVVTVEIVGPVYTSTHTIKPKK